MRPLPPFSRIRGNALKPERLLKAALRARQVDFVPNPAWLVGKPDVVLPDVGLAVFVDGCFWHRCPLHWKVPKTNTAAWTEKAARNAARDERVSAVLREAGWVVLRIWEHDLTTEKKAAEAAGSVVAAARRLRKRLRGRTWAMPDRDPLQLPLGT